MKQEKAEQECHFVIAKYFDGFRQAPWFWPDTQDWWVHSDENLWMGTYENAVKLANAIGGVSIMTLECAKEIVSHYEEINS